MRAEEPDPAQKQPFQEERESIWSITRGRRALYFGLFTAYAMAGIGFLIWHEVFVNTADTWQQTILSITQGIGVNTVGAAGLALLTIEGPKTFMVLADYIEERWVKPLRERNRAAAEARRVKIRAEAEAREARIRAEGAARNHTAWVAWNRRRMDAEARGESFDEPTPELPTELEQDDDEPPGTSSTEGE